MQPTITMMKSAPVMLRWIRLDMVLEFFSLWLLVSGQPLAARFNETLRVSSFKFQRSLRDLVSSQPLAASSIVGSEEGQCTARCSPKDCDVSMVFVLNAML